MTSPSAPESIPGDPNNYIVDCLLTQPITRWYLSDDKETINQYSPAAASEKLKSFYDDRIKVDVQTFIRNLISKIGTEAYDAPQKIQRHTRASFLHLKSQIEQAAGMSSRYILATLRFTITNRVVGSFTSPEGQPYLVPVTVEFYHDKSILLSAEFPLLTQIRVPGKDGTVRILRVADGELIDLYVSQNCDHNFVGKSAGRCYTIYTCTSCGHRYDIDSSD